MKLTSGISRGALLSAASLAALLAMPAHGQTAQGDNVNLGGMTVTDTAIDDPEAETSYKVTRSTSAMRTDTALIDTPQSVNVVTVKQIQDQAANSIGDAIRYVPGVFSAQGEGNRETLLLRGNSTTGDFFVDGVRDDVQTYRDLYNIEELQVFKGPNAMVFGRGGIGGLINRVTKVADWTPHQAFRIEGGSYRHARGSIDVGTPLSDFAAIRLTGVIQDSHSYRDGVTYNRWGLNPTVSFKLSPDTIVTLGYEHFEDERVADRGVSSYLGRPLNTPRGTFFGNADQSPTFTNTDAFTFKFEHRFNDAIVIRNHTRYADYDKFYQNVFPAAVNAAAQVNPRGLPLGTYAAGTIVDIQAYNQATRRKNFISQTDLNVEFDTGGIQHTLLLGFEYGRQTTDNIRLEGLFNVPGVPVVTGATPSPTSVFARIASPTVNFPVTWTAGSSSGSNYSVAKVAAGYIQDQIEFGPMFQLVLGVRYEHFNTKVTDRRTIGFPAGQQRLFDVTDNLWSPRAALIFKPIENASIYAGYSRTYLPRGGDQLSGLTLANQNLAPEKYQNYEIGAKWDLNPELNLQLALFRLDRSNVLALSNPNVANSPTIPIGRQRTDGIEFSVTGNITDQLSVVGASSYSDATFLDSQSGTVRAGNRVPNVPKHAASLWTRFNPIEKLGLAAGIIYQGRRFASTDNLVSMPGYTRVDAAIYYDIAEPVSLQLNIENLFNKRYFLFAHNNTNITPGSPTAFRVSLGVKF